MIRILTCVELLAVLAFAVLPVAVQSQGLPMPSALSTNGAGAKQPSIRLLGMAFSSPTVHSNEPVKLVLRLTAPAPSGGYTLLLKSNDKTLPLPHLLTIPARSSAIGLTVVPHRVISMRTVRVDAASVAEVTLKPASLVAYSSAQLRIAPASDGAKGGRP